MTVENETNDITHREYSYMFRWYFLGVCVCVREGGGGRGVSNYGTGVRAIISKPTLSQSYT